MSNVLTEKFIRLKTAVGGNREVMAYEDTFGMTKEEQAHITRPNQWNTRILSELEFALNLREDGAFDEAIGRALDLLLKAMEEEGVLSNAVCQKAEGLLEPLQQEAKNYQLILAAHAHIDMNWMWSYPETVAATLATFRTMLTLMEEYPDFHFSQSQAAVYEIVEKYDPDMMEEIKQTTICPIPSPCCGILPTLGSTFPKNGACRISRSTFRRTPSATTPFWRRWIISPA